MEKAWEKYLIPVMRDPNRPRAAPDPAYEAELDRVFAEYWKEPVIVDEPLPPVPKRRQP